MGKTVRLDKIMVHIVGVLSDIRFKGARQAVQPTIYLNDKIDSGTVSVRLTGQDVPSTINSLHRPYLAPHVTLDGDFAQLPG